MIISADAHIQEPDDLFSRHFAPHDQFRAPAFHRFPNGMKLWTVNGTLVARTPDYLRPVRGSADEFELIRADDVQGFIDDMDADGVEASVLHPNVGLLINDLDDPEFAAECARIYNDHVAGTYSGTGRLFPQAVIPLHDIGEAVREIERAANLGFTGLELPMSAPPEAPYFSCRYDPVWSAAQRLGLPVVMHVGSGLKRGSTNPSNSLSAVSFTQASNAGLWPEESPDHLAAMVAVKTTLGGFGAYGGEAAKTIPALVGGGIPERFPDVHFIFVEVGARWLLHLMDLMDDAWHVTPGVNEVIRTFFRPDGSMYPQFQPEEIGLAWPYPLKPSEYVRRQMHVTFMDDPVALRNAAFTGFEPLIWGNDYPHNEGTWPCSQQAIAQQCERVELSDTAYRDVFGGTIARILNLPANLQPA